jgi:hypothetical protein
MTCPLCYVYHVVEVVWIPDRALMCALDPDLEVVDCSSNGLYMYNFNGQHTINRVISCSLICSNNLASNEGTRLDYCDMISSAGDFGMTIIMLDSLFFMLSCQLTPTNVPSLHHGRCVSSGATYALVRPYLSSGVGSKVAWARLLVGIWCEDTCHVVISNPRSGQDLPLVLGVWSVVGSFLGEACSRLRRGSCTGAMLLRLDTEGTLVLGYRQRTIMQVIFFNKYITVNLMQTLTK